MLVHSPGGALARPFAVVTAAAGFAVLIVLVGCRWPALATFDRACVATANDWVAGRPALISTLQFVSDLGDRPALRTAALIATGILLALRRFRAAIFVVCASFGGWILELSFKAAVGRTRPVVDVPVSVGIGEGFPSGHAIGSLVTYGAITLVFLPVDLVIRRRAAVVLMAGLVLGIGFTRIALGLHFPSDVAGGWLLGAWWLGLLLNWLSPEPVMDTAASRAPPGP